MTTLKKPKLALLDEHTASLDPKTANTVLDLTQQLIENQGITTLMVTHNMEQALRMGHRTIMMHEGKIIPVSYTHLDVYKRQGLSCLKLE